MGDAGNININTNSLTANNFSFIITDNLGQGKGNSGNINLDATDSVYLGDDAFFNTNLGEGVEGKAGDINITSSILTIDGSQLKTFTSGTGDAGNIDINASERVLLLGRSDILSVLLQN